MPKRDKICVCSHPRTSHKYPSYYDEKNLACSDCYCEKYEPSNYYSFNEYLKRVRA